MGTTLDGSAIDAVLREAVETGRVPHVAAIVADRDGIRYEGGAGPRIVGESEEPVTTSTQFAPFGAVTGPDAEDIPVPVDGDADGDVEGPVGDLPGLAAATCRCHGQVTPVWS